MNRLALRNLLRRIVMASLPLAAACEHDTLPGVSGDMTCMPQPVVTDMALYGVNVDLIPIGFGGCMCWQVVDGTLPVGTLVDCSKLCTCTIVNSECLVESTSCGRSIIRCSVPGFGRVPAGLEPGLFASSTCEVGAFWARAA